MGTTHCVDMIVSMWRPEYAPGLNEENELALRGQVKMAALKSRYGPQMIEHLVMNSHTGSIIPPVMISCDE